MAQMRAALKGFTKCPVSNATCPYMNGSPAEAETAVRLATSRCPFLARTLADEEIKPAASPATLVSKCPFHNLMSASTSADPVASYNSPMTGSIRQQYPVAPQDTASGSTRQQYPVAPQDAASGHPLQQPNSAWNQEVVEDKQNRNTQFAVEPTDYDAFTKDIISGLKAEGRYRTFRRIERKRGELPRATADGTPEVVNWCSNDYLAMGQTEEVVGAAQAAALHQNTGMARLKSSSHLELEKELADLHGKEAAKVYNSCYTANEAAISGIVRAHPGCTIISDSSNHASMIQGIRQSGAPKLLWQHNDLKHLEKLLQALPPQSPKLVVFESVYSMDGSVAPIEKVLDICEKYNAMTFLDEVHAVGLYGHEGAGVAQRDGVMHRVDAITGTLGKAYGVMGGYVALSGHLAQGIDGVVNGSVPYQADNFLPPPVVEAALSSVQALRGPIGTQMREAHQAHANGLMEMLKQKGMPVQPSASHIVPVIVGDAVKCKAAADLLMTDHNIYVQPINYPTVARGTERLRFTPGPLHTDAMQEHLVHALEDVWKKVGIQVEVAV